MVGTFLVHQETQNEERTVKPIAGAALASVFTQLPDLLEPAVHPNHRQFFHSIAFSCMVSFFAYQLYRWEPDDNFEKVVRFALLVGCGAYLFHLSMDAFTPRSLPLVGKI